MKFPLHPKVIDFLLDHFSSSAKFLIKAIEALTLRTHLSGRQSSQMITVSMAKQILQDLLAEEQQRALTLRR